MNGSLLPNGSNGTVPDYTVNAGAALDVTTTNSLNPAIAAKTGAFTDLLDGSFTTNVVKGAAFDLTGFGSFSGVAAGGTVDQTVSYDHHGAPYGLYEEIITFTPTSLDGPLGDSTLAPITLTIEGTAAPEATTITMMLAGFTGIFLAGRRVRNRKTEIAMAF